jgi:arylsulfatase A
MAKCSTSIPRSGNRKLHVSKERPKQLYDLKNDIGESTNVIKSHPEVVKKPSQYLKDFAKDIADNNRPTVFGENSKPLPKVSM